MSEKKFYRGLVEVTYKFRKAKYDKRFLIIVFSGFRPRGSQYDFDGKGTEAIHANILWIKDDHHGSHTYYIRSASGFEFSGAVNALINEKLLELGLDYKHCLLAGFSKGASGALFHALKYNFPNLLITVPRMNIASSNVHDRPELLESLLGRVDETSINELDSVLPDLLKSDLNLAKNIYLITSESDPQYQLEIAPFIGLYEKFENFNIIRSASPLIRGHTDVTRYNLSTIYGIMMLFTDGIIPVFGAIHNGFDHFDSSKSHPSLDPLETHDSPKGAITRISIRDGILSIAGHVVVRGISMHISNEPSSQLVLKSNSVSKHIALSHEKNFFLNEIYFENTYFDYSDGAFRTQNNISSDLSDLPMGRYSIGIETSQNVSTWEIKDIDTPQVYRRSVSGNALYQVLPNGVGSVLVKQPLSGRDLKDIYFTLEKFWSDDLVVHVEGYFIVPGLPAKSYSDVGYYLLIGSDASDEIVSVVDLAIGNKPQAGAFIDDPFVDYSKAYYTTRSYAGIGVRHLDIGTYSLSISCVISGSVFTKSLGSQLVINNRSARLQTSDFSQYKLGLYQSLIRNSRRGVTKIRKLLRISATVDH